MTTEALAEPRRESSPATVDGTPNGVGKGLRGRFNVWFFLVFDRYVAHIARRHKEAAFGGIEAGVVVEIGPGVGANFDYVPVGSKIVAIEPNVAMHAALRARAEERGVELELHTTGAESMPLDDDSVDDVVCSLVLCTVADPSAVLAEIKRVLRPGGRFRFVEHVAAPLWSPRRWLQHLLRRPWRWLYEGCDLCRDTASTIEAAGFAKLEQRVDLLRHSLFIPANTALHGIATVSESHHGCAREHAR